MNSPVLALDIGRRRTGVALSRTGTLVESLPTITTNPPHQHRMINEVIDHIREHGIVSLVVGFPAFKDESPSQQSQFVERTVAQLKQSLAEQGLSPEIILVNEFNSTKDGAIRYPHTDSDSAAAAIILETALETTPYRHA